jgi:hypothetical protein
MRFPALNSSSRGPERGDAISEFQPIFNVDLLPYLGDCHGTVSLAMTDDMRSDAAFAGLRGDRFICANAGRTPAPPSELTIMGMDA